MALPPVAQRALRAKLVVWVASTAFTAALLVGGLWTWTSHETARVGADRMASVSLALAARTLEQALDQAGREAVRVAEDPGLRAALEWLGTTDPEAPLRAALASSPIFESGVLLDPDGLPVAWFGEDPALPALVAQLQPRNATDADLDYVMRGVDLRKAMASQRAAATRRVSLDETSRPVAGAPIRAANGRVIGSFHGLLGQARLASVLTLDDQAAGTRLQLLDGQGRAVAVGPGLAGDWGGRWTRDLDADEPAGWTLVLEQSMADDLLPVVLPAATSLAVAVLLAGVCGLLVFWGGSRQVRPFWELYRGLREARDGEAVELPLPGVQGEVESLVLAFNDTIHQLHGKRLALERELHALRGQNSAFQSQRRTLAQLSVTDALTQLANRRSLEDQLRKEVKRLARHGEGLAMLVIDIDDFKKINDELGHAAGDEFLVQVARILKDMARETDIVARYGGEEFVVIATGTGLEGATVLAEKLRTAVAEASFIVEETKRPRRTTVSIGVAMYRGSQSGLFNAADAALYEAKAAGKNCVQVAG